MKTRDCLIFWPDHHFLFYLSKISPTFNVLILFHESHHIWFNLPCFLFSLRTALYPSSKCHIDADKVWSIRIEITRRNNKFVFRHILYDTRISMLEQFKFKLSNDSFWTAKIKRKFTDLSYFLWMFVDSGLHCDTQKFWKISWTYTKICLNFEFIQKDSLSSNRYT